MNFKPKRVSLSMENSINWNTKLVKEAGILWLFMGLLTVIAVAQPKHYLITGSFNNLKAANDFSDALRLKGYSPQVIFSANGGTNYRVSIYQSSNKQEVNQYRAQLPGQGKPYWILTVGAPTSPVLPNSRTTAYARGLDPIGTRYHLVVGSFSTSEAANRSATAMQAQNFDAYVLQAGAGSNLHRVAIYNSNDRKEVETYQRMLKRSSYNPGMIVTESPSSQLAVSTGTENLKLANTQVTFHLIAGSFKTYAQAREYELGLRQKGHDAIVMTPAAGNTTWYRVSAYRSSSRKAASDYKKKLSGKGWVWEEK